MLEIENWLNSKQYHSINGVSLIPVENPVLKRNPIIISRGQADVVVCEERSKVPWMIKKFKHGKNPDFSYIKAIQGLIPKISGFEAGCNRYVIEKKTLATPPNDLKNWLDETILMPKIKGVTWAELADDIRDGSVALNNQQRLALVGSLSALMLSLENNQISHRDLSSTNIMIDKSTLSVSLIDWDCMYHPSISMPKNTTFGTEGYISPFVYKTGNPITTWKEKSDRFSLAVFNVEFLGLAKGSPLAHDGGMFEQTKICMTNVYTFAKLLSKAQTDFPFAITLFERALNAKTFDDCPAPSEWFAFTGMPSVAPGPSISPPPPPIITPSPPPRPVFTSIYSTIKYCPRCGADRDDDYSNCPACGLYVAYMA